MESKSKSILERFLAVVLLGGVKLRLLPIELILIVLVLKQNKLWKKKQKSLKKMINIVMIYRLLHEITLNKTLKMKIWKLSKIEYENNLLNNKKRTN